MEKITVTLVGEKYDLTMEQILAVLEYIYPELDRLAQEAWNS